VAIVGYAKPDYGERSFTCPHCNCYSQHDWRPISLQFGGVETTSNWTTSWCLRCNHYCFWKDCSLVWPLKSGLPGPIDECPGTIKAVYNEAREVFPYSPRAAAALLRLAIQMICVEKGLPGKDLNKDIGALVKSGLSAQIQQSLDLVRVVGNNAVHPGQIQIDENKDKIEKFFGLANLIVDVLIVQPAKITAMFDTLVPQPQKNQIAARDAKP
jgi:hypothetical protein